MSQAVVFDVGRVLFQWQLAALFEKLIDDREELEWFLGHVVTEEWHFEHDRGRALADMVPERIALFPQYEAHIRAYATRFNETVPGPVDGTHEIVERLHARGVPLYCLTNFGDEFWAAFRPTQPIFDRFAEIIVSGVEKVAKPEPRIYEIVETRSGREGAALFFTDDNPANIEAARARGWNAHLFTDAAGLEAALADAGLL
ncbi:HAD-IA family hydrolase [Erythrobacter dokdonensis]|uniref:Hydrolase, haloacid dehalogenase-like family protein n=1 Tax=Erythrobacter dokdonensis DSW-74 TaxID=1300349 RepID=A0A1A7BDP3_9SPHN|nr:HAD-IA family hydrolase [Erythrobacter dokdonensis]OBV09876.1 Hydrolase, haloacid dehalogenase-like family protein [Erythrobacter dokdonensis DSW-74]